MFPSSQTNRPLSEIPKQDVVQDAVKSLREYLTEYRQTEKEAYDPTQVGWTLKEIIEEMKSRYRQPMGWAQEFGFIYGEKIRSHIRKIGCGENYLMIGNLNDYWLSFVLEALKDE